MREPKRGPVPGKAFCPMTTAVAVIGGKWKPMIVYSLLSGTKRFGELRRLVPAATQQMLTLQLRELERDGIVHREVYAEVPPKVEYSLTPLGRELDAVLAPMFDWGRRYLGAAAAPLPRTSDAVSAAPIPPHRNRAAQRST